MRVEPNISREALFDRLDYKPHSEGQWAIHNSTARYRAACCGRRYGKALALDTPIPTPDGFKTMGELEQGDRVFDEQGDIVNVINTSPIMYGRKCYRVIFNDGNEIVADAEHLWYTWDKRSRKAINDSRRQSLPDVITTEQIKKTLYTNSGELNHAVQVTQPLKFDYHDDLLVVEPYVLGIWLGDGSSRDGGITTADLEIVSYIAHVGYEIEKSKAKYRYGTKGLYIQLKELNLIRNKHIPNRYLFAPPAERKALLEGLMDSDGCAQKNGTVEFVNKNHLLCEGVYWLAASLGYKPRWGKTRIINDTNYHRVYFIPPEPVFRLERKKLTQLMQQGRGLQRYLRMIKDVIEIDSVPVKCITVDSLSKLYLAGIACIPTHNSQAFGHEMTYKMFVPESVNWICGPDYSLGEKEFRVVYRDFGKLGLLKYCNKSYNVKQGNMRIHFKELDSLLEVKSAERPDSLVGEGLDHVIMSEAAKHKMSTWQMFIQPGLTDKLGSADFPSTPEGWNWYEGLYQLGQNPDFADYASWRLPSWENEIVFPGSFKPNCPNIIEGFHFNSVPCDCNKEIVQIFNTVSAMYFWQEYGAEFTSFEGLIYPEFDENTHVFDFGYQPQFESWWALDFGYTDPFICLDIFIDSQDRVYVWREYLKSYVSTFEHGTLLKQRENPEGFHVDGIAADPRGADEIATLAYKIGAISHNAVGVSLGYEAIKQALRRRPDGTYGLYISSNCPETICSIKSLRANEGKPGYELTRGQFDHPADALRYFFNERFVLRGSVNLADVYAAYRGSEAAGFFQHESGLTLNQRFS